VIHSPGAQRRERDIFKNHHQSDNQYQTMKRRKISIKPNVKHSKKLFEKSPNVDNVARNSQKSRLKNHNISKLKTFNEILTFCFLIYFFII